MCFYVNNFVNFLIFCIFRVVCLINILLRNRIFFKSFCEVPSFGSNFATYQFFSHFDCVISLTTMPNQYNIFFSTVKPKMVIKSDLASTFAFAKFTFSNFLLDAFLWLEISASFENIQRDVAKWNLVIFFLNPGLKTSQH